MFTPCRVYNRKRDIHAIYGGQEQGGICTPSKYPVIFIFTRDNEDDFGYIDHWTDNGVFVYTGEGQIGDMQFTKGNKAIRDHIENGKDIYLFEYGKKGNVRFIGNMLYTGYYLRDAKDRDGNIRKAIEFELVPAENYKDQQPVEDDKLDLSDKSLSELRKIAADAPEGYKTVQERQKVIRIRSAAVKEYALKRANGICECCNKEAPFNKPNGEPYLEVHHINRLSDGGPDKPEWVAAVCPNCHGEAHHGENKKTVKEKLLNAISHKEKSYEQ